MNDEVKPVLKPANENPWYLLATLYGEVNDLKIDSEIANKNRIAWNRWFAKGLSAGQRNELLNKGFLPRELVPFTPKEEEELATAFKSRSGGMDQALPKQTSGIDFSHTIFDNTVFLNGFNFRNSANFESATFSSSADFDSATFSGRANFGSAKFSGRADFNSATFSGDAYFRSATFSGDAYFRSATFSGCTYFINSEFNANTNLANVHFNLRVPDFHGAKMHEGTEWHGINWPSVPTNKDSAQEQVYNYERLKQEMERLKKHEDEQFFFCKELRARRELMPLRSVGWLLNYHYEALSNYGQSTNKPLLWLIGSLVLGCAGYVWSFYHAGTVWTVQHAASLSFANTFPFFPFHKEIITPDVFASLSNLAKILGVVQSIFGTLMLFLLGLALRNRFRMR